MHALVHALCCLCVSRPRPCLYGVGVGMGGVSVFNVCIACVRVSARTRLPFQHPWFFGVARWGDPPGSQAGVGPGNATAGRGQTRGSALMRARQKQPPRDSSRCFVVFASATAEPDKTSFGRTERFGAREFSDYKTRLTSLATSPSTPCSVPSVSMLCVIALWAAYHATYVTPRRPLMPTRTGRLNTFHKMSSSEPQHLLIGGTFRHTSKRRGAQDCEEQLRGA